MQKAGRIIETPFQGVKIVFSFQFSVFSWVISIGN
jgi:hypothetical protein